MYTHWNCWEASSIPAGGGGGGLFYFDIVETCKALWQELKLGPAQISVQRPITNLGYKVQFMYILVIINVQQVWNMQLSWLERCTSIRFNSCKRPDSCIFHV